MQVAVTFVGDVQLRACRGMIEDLAEDIGPAGVIWNVRGSGDRVHLLVEGDVIAMRELLIAVQISHHLLVEGDVIAMRELRIVVQISHHMRGSMWWSEAAGLPIRWSPMPLQCPPDRPAEERDRWDRALGIFTRIGITSGAMLTSGAMRQTLLAMDGRLEAMPEAVAEAVAAWLEPELLR